MYLFFLIQIHRLLKFSSNINNISGVNYFKELSFYNKPTEKPKIKPLQNINLLAEQLFYEQLNIIKTNQAFRGYAMSYRVEIVEKKGSNCTMRSK